MARATHDLKGYTIVLDKVVLVTRVFEADNREGFQFNVRFSGDTLLALKFATRHDAELERANLVKALAGH